MNNKVLYATFICAALVAGCSSQQSQPNMNISNALLSVTEQNGRACVQGKDIRGFGVLEKDVLSINAFNEYYLATVLPGCNDLSLSARAMFQERFGDVCGGGMNRVRTQGNHCQIKHLFKFDNREEAFAAHAAALELQAKSAEQKQTTHD